MAPSTLLYPIPPVEFGRDGGEFYKHYDKIADELDNGMVKGLKSNLDGLLIFAGLFAGINTAFLALTLPKMSADPADDTNALLLELIRGNNETASSLILPSANFAPNRHIYTVNFLFLISLASALFASFFAVIGKQWLAYYQTPEGSGGDKQRGEQLKRAQGVERWRFIPILDGLIPLLLQLALLVFAVGIILYLKTLSNALAYTVIALSALTLICFFLTVGVSFWDPYSPYKTPVSQLVNWCCDRLIAGSLHALVLISRALEDALHLELSTAGKRNRSPEEVAKEVGDQLMWKLPLQRKADPPAQLQGDFIRRILAVSADREAVFHAALNIHSVRDPLTIRRIIEDDVALARLRELFMDLDNRGPRTDGSPPLSISMGRDAIVFGGAILQLTLFNKHVSASITSPTWSPESLFQSSTGFASMIGAYRSEVEVSAMTPFPASYSMMMWLWKAWLEDRSPAQLLTFKTAAAILPPPPLQTTAFIALSLTVSLKLEVTDPSQTFASWTSSLFSDIHDVFWKIEMDDDLTELICNAIQLCTRSWDKKPSVQVYIALLKGVTAQIRRSEQSNDDYYLGPIIRAVGEVLVSIALSILSQKENPEEASEPELWPAFTSAAFNLAHACLEHSLAALKVDPTSEASFLHRESIMFQVDNYLTILLDDEPVTKFEDLEALRTLEPLMRTISKEGRLNETHVQNGSTLTTIDTLLNNF
ncbi:hypothetical protein FRB90_005374 [Tulasnella sp. 427]|nr:hypothetical protein FRB90_005374 [Tulasnella sp. 427]